MFEDVTHDRSPILLLLLTDSYILKESKFTDHERNFVKDIALEKKPRQRFLKEQVAVASIESDLQRCFLLNKRLQI